MNWICQKISLFRTKICSLKIEPFAIIFLLSTALSDLTTPQLIQDKICLNKYNQTDEYCIGISALKTSGSGNNDDQINTKNKILADLAQFSIYGSLIGSVPTFFYMLFIGSWSDNYIHGRKIALLLGSLGHIGMFTILLLNAINFDLGEYYILLSSIPPALTGGWSCVWLSLFSYMSNNSSPESRLIRFGIFDIILTCAGPFGTFLGGRLLGTGNLRKTGLPLHNYQRVYTASLVGNIIAFFWILIVINENKTQNDENSNLINSTENEIQENILNNNNNNNDIKEQKPIKTTIDRKFRFSKMFDIENIKEVFRTAIKVRPNKGRAQIWLLYLSMCFVIMSDVKGFGILFPFVEEVYDWNASQFSEIKSLSSIVEVVSKTVCVFLLSAYLKLSDSKLGIIGFLSSLFAALCIGSVIYPIGLYLMYVVGSATALSFISIRSMISKLVPKTESGKVFSLLAALETMLPMVTVPFYNTLFEYTIDFYPSLCFQIAGVLMFIPIFIFIWIDLTRIHV